MRIATEICHRCGSQVFEDDISTGTATDELSRCLCPRCSSFYIKPLKLRGKQVSSTPALPPFHLYRLGIMMIAALILSSLLIHMKTASTRLPQTSKQVVMQAPKSIGPQIINGSQSEKLERLTARLRLRRELRNEILYRKFRDATLRLMENNRYGKAADLIDKYPSELRNGANWEMRLAPLWNESERLSKVQKAYESALSESLRLAREGNLESASTKMENFAMLNPDTPWSGSAVSRAESLKKMRKPIIEPQKQSSNKPAKQAPVQPIPPAPPPLPPTPEPKKLKEKDKLCNKVMESVRRGVKYLQNLQAREDGYQCSYSRSYSGGPTALALLAQLKCGVKRGEECIEKGFGYLSKRTLRQTYSVSLYMLALAARYEPEISEYDPHKPLDEQVKNNFKRRASNEEKQTVLAIVAWLRDAQLENSMWTYNGQQTSVNRSRRQGSRSGDGSNTQFAALALYTAHRLGVKIPRETVSNLASAYLDAQDKDGPVVERFHVPAADLPISLLRREEKKALSKKDGPHTVTVDELYGSSKSSESMRARGWGYSPTLRSRSYFSMTCAGVCNMLLAKAVLEGTSGYGRKSARIDGAIRDGAAYISSQLDFLFDPMQGGRMGWGLYYNIYSLERAGMLTLCEKFGKHEWYTEGARFLLEIQKSDGSWGGNLVDTCFALLFLSRSTAPFIRTSGTIYTGPDLFPRKKK